MTACEIISFWLGQCGIQLGDACWELFCLEHEISPEGNRYYDNKEDDSYKHFFRESIKGQYVPRTLLVDLEPNVVDEVRCGVYRKLFHPDFIVNGLDDASNNFARGFYTCGKELLSEIIKSTRKLAECCDNIQAFLTSHSYSGGTGSGISSLILEFLALEYPKVSRIQFGVFPSPTLSTAIVEPYNTVMALHTPLEKSDMSLYMDNESMFNICCSNLEIDYPLYTNLNRLQAQVFSGLTASVRFEGPMAAKLVDLQTNLVPFPRIHFPLISYAPIKSPDMAIRNQSTVKDITQSVFSRYNQLVSVDLTCGLYMSCVNLYRGDISIVEINNTISNLKSHGQISFVNWCPTGFKTSINYQPMTVIPSSGMAFSHRSVTMLMSNTAVGQLLKQLTRKFLLPFNKRAFVHWYISEGMEEGEFVDGLNTMLMLQKDYDTLNDQEERSEYFGYQQPPTHAPVQPFKGEIASKSSVESSAEKYVKRSVESSGEKYVIKEASAFEPQGLPQEISKAEYTTAEFTTEVSGGDNEDLTTEEFTSETSGGGDGELTSDEFTTETTDDMTTETTTSNWTRIQNSASNRSTGIGKITTNNNKMVKPYQEQYVKLIKGNSRKNSKTDETVEFNQSSKMENVLFELVQNNKDSDWIVQRNNDINEDDFLSDEFTEKDDENSRKDVAYKIRKDVKNINKKSAKRIKYDFNLNKKLNSKSHKLNNYINENQDKKWEDDVTDSSNTLYNIPSPNSINFTKYDSADENDSVTLTMQTDNYDLNTDSYSYRRKLRNASSNDTMKDFFKKSFLDNYIESIF